MDLGPIVTGLPDTELRERMRSWLAEHSQAGWRQRLATATTDEWVAFTRDCAARLSEAGLLAPHWPQEFGGGGFSFSERLVLQEELRRADFPSLKFLSVSLHHAAATLMQHGTAGQQRMLAGILGGDIWCQGFSEPEAGSDLAALRTCASRSGEGYLVNGQKIWSSRADYASWCLLLARTDPTASKHKGISLFMLELASPGVEIRPIRQATGASEFCEIFLTDVHIPIANRIGEENDGWRLAQTTLSTERASQVVELHAELAVALDRIAAEAATTAISGGRIMANDPAFRQELAQRAAEVDVLGLLAQRLVGNLLRYGDIGPEGSIVKLVYSETLQRLTSLGTRVRGPVAQLNPHREVDISWTSGAWQLDHLKSWVWTIAAGSNEIQRNIIGERVLGLPREPLT